MSAYLQQCLRGLVGFLKCTIFLILYDNLITVIHQLKCPIWTFPSPVQDSYSVVELLFFKYKNNVIECDHGKLKLIIRALLGFKSMKTAYATIKGIEVMRALRKGQASSVYYGQPQGEVYLINRVFDL